MSTIRIADLLEVHKTLIQTMTNIDKIMEPGVERAMAWRDLNHAQNIIRVAIESAGSVEIKEVA